MRSTWTDSRLDDLNGRVGEIREEVRDVRRDIGDLKRAMIHRRWPDRDAGGRHTRPHRDPALSRDSSAGACRVMPYP